jgi:hypothetical protein
MRGRRTFWIASALLLASMDQEWAQGYGGTIGIFQNHTAPTEMATVGQSGVSVPAKSAMTTNPTELGILNWSSTVTDGVVESGKPGSGSAIGWAKAGCTLACAGVGHLHIVGYKPTSRLTFVIRDYETAAINPPS